MYETLFTLFGFEVNAYAAITICGYGIGMAMGIYLGLKDGREWRDMVDGGIVIVISAVFGAKLFHFLFESRGHALPDGRIAEGVWDVFLVDPWHWVRIFQPGYVFYGGVIVATLMGFLFALRRGVEDPTAAGDYAAPGLALGIFFGRLGCLAAGCCYGAQTDVAWAISFPESHATAGALVHPVQIYDATFGLVAFLACLYFYKRRRFGGDLLAGVLVFYALWRFVTEIFRADDDRGVWLLGLSTSQLVSLLLFPIGVAIWTWMARRLSGQYPEKYGQRKGMA
jgi:phosphatidylglycerol---prolipoprotein diacylglyceryl transferase